MKHSVHTLKTQVTRTLHLNYLLSLPQGYGAESGARWPLILFLHGVGERGTHPESLKKHGIPKVVEEREDFPFITLSPQCPPNTTWWDHVDALDALLHEVVATYAVDTARIYLTGLSMGGYGTWSLATLFPGRFAAIAPICGGGSTAYGFPQRVCVLKDVPVWVFHGAQDTSVPLRESKVLVKTLRRCGGKVRFTVYPEAGHDVWTETYANPALYTWFLEHRRKEEEEMNKEDCVMSTPQIVPYGSWKSPITADLIVSETVRLGEVVLDGADIYWLEGRPAEGGRNVIVHRTPDGRTRDVLPAPFNAQTQVHEYGGGAYTVHAGVVYFSNFADQRLYRLEPGGEPEPLTPEKALRYADGVVDPHRGVMFCVREDHTGKGQVINTLVSLNLAGDPEGGRVLVSGNDFYASPRLSPDGRRLAWLTWNHPNMPWDGTELWVAEVLADGILGDARLVAGGATESIFQPEWSPDGTLYFVSDRTGWWNLYRWQGGESEPLCPQAAEFGLPQWVFGMTTYTFISPETLLCTYTQDGSWYLARLDVPSHDFEVLALPYTRLRAPQVGPEGIVVHAGAPAQPSAIVLLEPDSGTLVEVLRRSSADVPDTGYLSAPESLEFPTANDLTAHAFFYRPQNRDYAAPADERPPLLVFSHGGPTDMTSNTLNLKIQYWTSRGFAVLDVNYGGSTGYGRAYRQRLNGQWGIVDVEDCVNGARTLVKQGLVDDARLAIRGGSAGGYTTLCALTFTDVFQAGASYFGIADAEALAQDTHKFESRYLDNLFGPYPERRDIYVARSPIHFTERLSCPVIFFQGLEDRVVLPNQAEMMVTALREKGVPVAYLPFAGEQHGFRRAETIKRALEAELYFYSRIFAFALAEPVEPVLIENL